MISRVNQGLAAVNQVVIYLRECRYAKDEARLDEVIDDLHFLIDAMWNNRDVTDRFESYLKYMTKRYEYEFWAPYSGED